MRVKIFSQPPTQSLENEVNAFLATLPDSAVRYVNTCAAGDPNEGVVSVVTVWYEELRAEAVSEQSLAETAKADLEKIIGPSATS